MPKKRDCCSDDEYVIYSCDSEISSYCVSVSETDDYCCDDSSRESCGSICCKSGDSSSKCSCSSSSRCYGDSSDYCCPAPYHEAPTHSQHTMVPPVPTSGVPRETLPSGVPAGVPTTGVPTSTEKGMMAVPPSSIPEAPNRSFRATITPIVDLKTPFSPTNTGGIAFTMRRMNGMVCMQHEPFSATIAANGVSHLSVGQSIGCLPQHPVDQTYSFRLNGVGKTGFIRIDPLDSSANIKFFLDQDERNVDNSKDSFEVSGGLVCWICSY